MSINNVGARNYWANRVWSPSEYEAKNIEVTRLSEIAIDYVTENNIKKPSILELCCGTGIFTSNLLSKLFSLGMSPESYHCIDISHEALSKLKDCLKYEYGKSSPNIYLHLGYFGEDSFDDISTKFDMVICCRALMHIPDITIFLSKAKEKLKPLGLFIADTIPKSERWRILKEKHGNLTAGLLETEYRLANFLASMGIGSKFFTEKGILRTENKSINEVNRALHDVNLYLVDKYSMFDQETNCYRFAAVNKPD